VLNVTRLNRFGLKRFGLGVIVALMVAMWFYAFFLSPRESINRVEDRTWSARAEEICLAARIQLSELADTRRIQSADDLLIRAGLVEQATEILGAMVDEVFEAKPTDDKGLAISELWRADYVTYLDDRHAYVALLRQGKNDPFAETRVDGIPLSEKLGTFARANDMDSCAPPSDLSV